MSEEKIEEVKNPIDSLFDEDDNSPIVLFNEKGEKISFEQIAVIPLEERVFAILKPIEKTEGVGEDEALVFEVVEPEDEEGPTITSNVEDNATVKAGSRVMVTIQDVNEITVISSSYNAALFISSTIDVNLLVEKRLANLGKSEDISAQ